MGNAVLGATLWHSWEENEESQERHLYYTFGHVSLDNDMVMLALAKYLQQSGEVPSLGYAFRILTQTSTTIRCTYAGHVGGEYELSFCDETGFTDYDGHVDEEFPRAITLVEVDFSDE